MQYIEYVKSKYPNFLDQTKITYDTLIETIKSFSSYRPPKKVLESAPWEVECVEHWGVKPRSDNAYPPMIKMVDGFYDYISVYGRIPNQYEFADHYFKYAQNNIVGFVTALANAGGNRDILINALTERCHRSYPSFVRDLEFALLLRDKFHMNVVYNKFLDTDMAIDLMYTGKSGTNYGIHLFTDTERAKKFRAEKEERHDDRFYNVIEIDYVMSMSRNTINGYKLYDMSDANRLIGVMKQRKLQLENEKGQA